MLLDIASGAVCELDRDAFDLVNTITPPMSDEPRENLTPRQREAWDELYELQEQGLLFAPEMGMPELHSAPLKALCLHISHDCNLRCGYCFAATGDFGTGRRSVMSPQTASDAIDFLLSRCQNRINLEIDFFGGEPLLGWDTVKHTIEYARAKAPEKNFRFTLTTNGLLLNDDISAYVNREIDNVVLSLDGREKVNDALRKTMKGQGSYAHVLPKYKALLTGRDRDYFIRGTYTSKNLDFVKDIEHLSRMGFESLSLEPVVLAEENPLAIKECHLPQLCVQYEQLCEKMLSSERQYSFFHFEVDLEQGPCFHKRVRGCGAGHEYAAVTPEGDVFPCHRFAGMEDYKMGSVSDKTFSPEISDLFRGFDVFSMPDCKSCWAKYYCGGGCVASNLTVNGNLLQSDAVGCALERKRLECAILLKIARFDDRHN
ncbi:MAG: thioether cross-link-forming SCIFF peptide maturase [Oscillospiraceae bacterium]|nr:thioether cross-link-forming SCIFF peptide maturase [Oscillospiraceae bacterium]